MSATMVAGHLPIETLLAWWLHETDAADTDAVDEHLLRCDACGETLDALVGLADGVRAAFKAGLVGAIASGDFIARLASRGHRVREYRLPCNGGVDCTVAPDDELLVAHLETPLQDVDRLDAVVTLSFAPDVQHRLEDVPFDAQAGEVLWLPKFDLIRNAPAHTAEVTLLSVDADAAHELGRYTFRHQPWPGG